MWAVGQCPSWPLYPIEREPVPLARKAGWANRPVWTGAYNLAPPGFESCTTQPVARHYTDYSISADRLQILFFNGIPNCNNYINRNLKNLWSE